MKIEGDTVKNPKNPKIFLYQKPTISIKIYFTKAE